MKRLLSLTILAILILSLVPATLVAIPTAAAQSVTIRKSRDTVFNETYAYIDFIFASPPSENNISVKIEVYNDQGALVCGPVFKNATRIGTTPIYRLWLYVGSDAELYWVKTDASDGSRIGAPKAVCTPSVALETGYKVKLTYGTYSTELVYKHTPATLSIRSPIPYDEYNNVGVKKVGVLDWEITAPDLNKDPLVKDVALANITVWDYTQNKHKTFYNVLIEETEPNSGVFKIVNTTNLDLTTLLGLEIYFGGPQERLMVENNTWTGDIEFTIPDAVAKLNVKFTNISNTNTTYVNLTDLRFNITFENVPALIWKDGTYLGIVPVNITLVNARPSTLPLSTSVSNIKNGTPEIVQISKTDVSIVYDNVVASSVYLPLASYGTPTLTADIKAELELTIVSYWNSTVSKTYYNVTIDKFNVTVDKISVNIPVSYSDVEHLYKYLGFDLKPYDAIDVIVTVPKCTWASVVDTMTKSLEVATYYGTVSVEASLSKGIIVTIEDPGRNYKSYANDTVTITLELPDGSRIPETAVEVERNSGKFVFELTADDLWSLYKSGVFSNTENEFNVTYIDSLGERRNVTAEIEYVNASVSVTPETVTDKSILRIYIKDPDLNLNPDERDVYGPFTVSPNSFFVITIKSDKLDQDVGRLMLFKVVGDTEELLNASKTQTSFTVTLVETGPDTGEFEAVVDLGKFDVSGADEIKVVYQDYFTNPVDAKGYNATATASIATVSLEAEEDSVPLSAHGAVAVHLKVVDPSANMDVGRAESVPVYYTVVLSNGTKLGPYGPVTLTETGLNTGVFTGTASIDLYKFGPGAVNGEINFTYTSTALGKTVYDTVKIKVYPVAMYVNGTSSIEVKYGDVINITIVDPELNLDQKEYDSFTAKDLGIEGLPEGVAPDIVFNETGPNTGVFTALVTATGDLGAPGKLELTYTDKVPVYTDPKAGSWDKIVPDEVGVTITILASNAKLSVKPSECGPSAIVTIEVADQDRDANPDEEDTVTVYYYNPATMEWKELKLTETDKHTGVFNGTLDISSLTTDVSKIVGKKVMFVYTDEYTTSGESKTLYAYVTVKTWNGTIETDKDTYNIGDRIRITVKDQDQNKNPEDYDFVDVVVYSSSFGMPITVHLRETEPDSGVFVGEVPIVETYTPGKVAVAAKTGDYIYIEYVDKYPAGYPAIESVVFKKVVRVGKVLAKPIELPVEKVKPVDMTGAELKEVKVGQAFGVNIPIENKQDLPVNVTVIVKVKDPEGYTIAVFWQTITVAGKSTAQAGFAGIVPKMSGSYTVEIYVVKSLEKPESLTEKLKYEVVIPVKG